MPLGDVMNLSHRPAYRPPRLPPRMSVFREDRQRNHLIALAIS
jgi:hypothetical protein